ncbi:hypothetical protein Tco_0423860, partial [Tanacetum coccineum]
MRTCRLMFKKFNELDHTRQEPPKEEFSDWPQGLLTIGTFGNNDLPVEKENPVTETSSPDL